MVSNKFVRPKPLMKRFCKVPSTIIKCGIIPNAMIEIKMNMSYTQRCVQIFAYLKPTAHCSGLKPLTMVKFRKRMSLENEKVHIYCFGNQSRVFPHKKKSQKTNPINISVCLKY